MTKTKEYSSDVQQKIVELVCGKACLYHALTQARRIVERLSEGHSWRTAGNTSV